MTQKKVARRYNLALYEIAKESNTLDAVKKDFEDIRKSIAGSKELEMFIKTPVIKLNKKADVMKALFGGKVNELTMRFLNILCEKNRIGMIDSLADDFIHLVNEKQGIVSAKIKTAINISDSEKASLTEKLKKYTGKNITAIYSVDPSIKGGFIAQIDDKIIDASITRQLELLREKFAQGNFNN
jgi:F-type H+-transporting ATPase subunit delta